VIAHADYGSLKSKPIQQDMTERGKQTVVIERSLPQIMRDLLITAARATLQ